MSELISIVIPLAKGETQWQHLCQNFALLPEGSEIILVAVEGEELEEERELFQQKFPKLSWKVIYSLQGRAIQLNQGATTAKGDFIWFLHADSQITEHNIQMLMLCLKQAGADQTLYYFDLYFHDKHNKWLKINELGSRFRSDLLGLPFGDQGFFMSKECFNHIGAYDVDAAYGEDHLFVWQAKHNVVPLKRCPSKLATSSRKYQKHGWKLTLKYQYLWPKQALPQLLKLLKTRFLARA